LVFTTVVQNGGYGLYLSHSDASDFRVNLDYNIIENNAMQDCLHTGPGAFSMNFRGPTLSDGSCAEGVVGDISPGPDDAFLGPLADNGGPTQTHALLEGSPALDAAGD